MRQELSSEEFARIIEGAAILEADRKRAEGLPFDERENPEGNSEQAVAVFFRRRSRAARFAHNARLLRGRGFVTVDVEKIYRWDGRRSEGVLYNPVPGETLRAALRDAEEGMRHELLRGMAAVLAKLHAAGILFRSIHFANVIVTPARELGLIDIVDVRFRRFRFSLSPRQRLRNFRHVLRYQEDWEQLSRFGWVGFLTDYFTNAAEIRNPEKLRGRLLRLPSAEVVEGFPWMQLRWWREIWRRLRLSRART